MKFLPSKTILVIALSGLVLTGCANITTQEEAATVARESLPDAPPAWKMAQENVGDVQVGWIASFNDPVLSALVEEAQLNNRDLRAAAANVESSLALSRQAGAALSPQVDLVAGTNSGGPLEGGGGTNTSYNVGLQLNWEIDVWGRIRAGEQAAIASAQAAEADYVFAQYSIAAGVAQAYFIAIEAGLQESIAEDTLEALTEITRIVQVQYDNGLANSQDLALTKSDLASAQDTVEAAGGSRRDALRALEVLLGRYPGADLDVREALPTPPPPPPAGVPSEILERRPDVISAERTVAAAFNSLDQAKAARMPRIALTSSVGGASTDLSEIFDPRNVAWNIVGNLAAPLIDGGQRQAQVEIANADQEAAVAAYGQTALDAFAEVESALDQGTVLAKRRAALEDSAKQAQEALRVARLRYNEGETDLIDVLSIQQRVFGAESNLASVQRLILDQRVGLNLALGGSWK